MDTVLAPAGTPLADGVDYAVYEAVKDADGNRKRVASSYGGRVKLPLPAGHYYITATYGSAVTGLDVDVRAGDQSIARTIDLRAGILRLSSVMAAGMTPLAEGVDYAVWEAAKDADGNRKRVAYSFGGQVKIPVPAGHYYVTATYGSVVAGEEVDVRAGDQSIARTIDLRAGILRLSSVMSRGATPLAEGVDYAVYEAAKDADGDRKRVADSFGGQVKIPVPAGHYYVTASAKEGNGGSEVNISPGEVRDVQLRLSRQNDGS